MKVEITLNVHREKGTNLLLLEHQDVFDFIGEDTRAEVELGYYLEKWCDYLNHYLVNSVPAHGDIKGTELRSWIDGYNFAKHIREEEFNDCYVLSMRGYLVTIYKPFQF